MEKLSSEMQEYVELYSKQVSLARILPAIERGNSLLEQYFSLSADNLNTPDIVREVATTVFLLEALRNRLLKESER